MKKLLLMGVIVMLVALSAAFAPNGAAPAVTTTAAASKSTATTCVDCAKLHSEALACASDVYDSCFNSAGHTLEYCVELADNTYLDIMLKGGCYWYIA